jgi:hypothetical protein
MHEDFRSADPDLDYRALARHIKHWGQELGFQQVGITDTDLGEDEVHLLRWLEQGTGRTGPRHRARHLGAHGLLARRGGAG